MNLFFMNGLFFESEDKSEIVTTLNTQFQKHNMLREAGGYKTAELIECILRASVDVDTDFIFYLVDDLIQTRRDCLAAEHRMQELQNELKQLIKQLKERLDK